MNKFNLGDKVKVVNYGHPIWFNKKGTPKDMLPTSNILGENEDFITWDMCPEMVGKEGIVRTSTETQGKPQYALEIPGKQAWYNENQLELVKANCVYEH